MEDEKNSLLEDTPAKTFLNKLNYTTRKKGEKKDKRVVEATKAFIQNPSFHFLRLRKQLLIISRNTWSTWKVTFLN